MALEQSQLLYLKLEKQRHEFVLEHGDEDFEVEPMFDVNQSLRQLNGYYDQLLSIMREPEAAEQRQAWDRFEQEVYASYGEPYLARAIIVGLFQLATGQGIPTRLLTEKLTLKLAQTLLPTAGAAERTVARNDTRRVVDATGLALLGYRDQHGELPGSIDTLVPTYLDAVPMDPYTDRELVYRVNDDGSALVYSVGENGQDDGGVDDYREGDITIRVGPPPGGGDQ